MGLLRNLFGHSDQEKDDDSRDEGGFGGPRCMNCGKPMRGSTLTSSWEEGNSSAYVTCKHCGYENYVSYGDDD